jgi:bla regulator protein blaR1
MIRNAHESSFQSPARWWSIGLVLLLANPISGMAATRDPVDSGSTNTLLSKADEDGSTYIFLSGENATSLNASGADFDQAQESRRQGEELFWARRAGKAWILRDASVLAEVHKILDPQINIEARQGATGINQADVGTQQAELGRRQAELGRQKAALQAEISKRRASRQKADDLKEQLRSLEKKEHALGSQQAELGQQQVALGNQQTELGRQQAKIAEQTYKELGALVDQAISKGLAQEFKP